MKIEEAIKKYNEDILRLWNEFRNNQSVWDELKKLWDELLKPKESDWNGLLPMFYDKAFFYDFCREGPRILIVGCNPSFYNTSAKGTGQSADKPLTKIRRTDTWEIQAAKEILKKADPTPEEVREAIIGLHTFLPDEDLFTNREKYERIIQFQSAAQGLNPRIKIGSYFNQITEFQKKIKCCNVIPRWAHVDLLAIRCTNQQKLKNYCSDKQSDAFVDKQIEYFLQLIESLEPDLILVANAEASCRLKNAEKHVKIEKCPMTQHFYTEKIRLNDGNCFAVIFSTMFTYMNEGIKDLLAWNVSSFLQHHGKKECE